jgi:hypothetical protein
MGELDWAWSRSAFLNELKKEWRDSCGEGGADECAEDGSLPGDGGWELSPPTQNCLGVPGVEEEPVVAMWVLRKRRRSCRGPLLPPPFLVVCLETEEPLCETAGVRADRCMVEPFLDVLRDRAGRLKQNWGPTAFGGVPLGELAFEAGGRKAW